MRGQEGTKASKSSLERSRVWEGCPLGVHLLFTTRSEAAKATWSGKSSLPGRSPDQPPPGVTDGHSSSPMQVQRGYKHRAVFGAQRPGDFTHLGQRVGGGRSGRGEPLFGRRTRPSPRLKFLVQDSCRGRSPLGPEFQEPPFCHGWKPPPSWAASHGAWHPPESLSHPNLFHFAQAGSRFRSIRPAGGVLGINPGRGGAGARCPQRSR